MKKSEFKNIYEEIGKDASFIIQTVDGIQYKGLITEELEEDGIFFLKDTTPYGSIFAILYEDVESVYEDKLAYEYEYIKGIKVWGDMLSYFTCINGTNVL